MVLVLAKMIDLPKWMVFTRTIASPVHIKQPPETMVSDAQGTKSYMMLGHANIANFGCFILGDVIDVIAPFPGKVWRCT